jgi:hypothetical protein
MDTGSNKSLYTLIAVVVFGIFLSLSYWMFQDNLKGVLADVMDRASETTSIKEKESFLVETDSKNLSFNASTGTILSYDVSGGKDVIIPKVINGVEVTGIGPSAFSEVPLNSVFLPDTITFIGTNAFWDCGLKSIRLSSTLTTISASALAWNQLTELDLPNSLVVLGGGSLRGNQLTRIRVPEGVTELNPTIFSHNRFTIIELPKSFENTETIDQFIDYYSWDGSTMVSISYLKDKVTNKFIYY